MQDLIGVEKGEGLTDVTVDVDLHVIGEAGLGQLQKVSPFCIILVQSHAPFA